MSTYQIDFSEPLRSFFTIPAGGFNGPGGSSSNSTLRLYGRGALEWGEAVDEDLLRLSENFASASPPSSAISGQLWVEVKLYYHNTSATATTGWYRWNLTTRAWELLNGNGVVATTQADPASLGQYFYGAVTIDGISTTGLYGYYSLGRYEPAAWVPRSTIEGAGAPPASLRPQQVLRLRDNTISATGRWTTPSVTAKSETEPSPPQEGILWYQPSTGVLRVYSSQSGATGINRWHNILGPSVNGAVMTSYSPIDMKSPITGTNNKIVNLGTPTDTNDAVNKGYADSSLTAGLSGKVSKSGDTMTGPLTVQGATTLAGLTTSGLANFNNGAKVTSGVLDMNNNRIINLGAPQNPTDAATSQYVINQATTIATTIVNNSIGPITNSSPSINPSGVYKTGDVYITNGRVYIAMGGGSGAPPGGNWVQVFPAVYS